MWKNIVKAAASDDEVSLVGFGKFKVKASPEREGRNPANGEKIRIAASKKLSFSPAKAVKTAVERAFQLARSGRFANLADLIRSLDRAGYSGKQIEGPTLRRQLVALLKAAREGSVNSDISSTDK